jgi:hypothetical protein
MMKRLFSLAAAIVVAGSLAAAIVVAGSLGASAQTATPKFQWDGNDLEVQKGATFYKFGEYGSSAFNSTANSVLFDRWTYGSNVGGAYLGPYLDLWSSEKDNAFAASSSGADIAFNLSGLLVTPRVRAAQYTRMTTKYDTSVGEFNHYIHTESKSQGAGSWVTLTAYAAGDLVNASSNTYKAQGACTTGAVAPSGTGTSIADGTCLWDYVEYGNSNEAVGIGNVMRCRQAAGGKPSKQCWGMALDFWSDPGSFPPAGGFQVPFELDAINGAKDCPPGALNACNFFGFYMRTAGVFKNTVGIQLEGDSVGTGGAYWGIHLSKGFGTSRGIIEGSEGSIGIKQDSGTGLQTIGYQQNGTQTTAGFDINGTTPTAMRLHGVNSGAAITIDGTSLVGVQVDTANVDSGFVATGAGGNYGFRSLSTAALYGASLEGTYTNDAMRVATGTSANAVHISGTQSTASVNIDGTTPIGVSITGNNVTKGIVMSGTHTGPDIDNASTVALGAEFRGTYSTAAIKLPSMQFTYTTVAALPTCDATHDGVVRAVNDANAPTYGAALAGGGAVKTLAFCDATSWKAH